MTRPRKNPYLRVRIEADSLPLPREGFIVCEGIKGGAWRRCHWESTGVVFESSRLADRAAVEFDIEAGVAVIDLSNPRLQLVDFDGQLRQCAELEDRMMS